MNKSEFIAAMEAQLIRLPKADRDDIINDYESHFVNGVAEGRTEEEVSAQLGDPVELAAVYLENLPEGAKGAPYIPVQEPEAEPQPQPQPEYRYEPQPEPQPAYTEPVYSEPAASEPENKSGEVDTLGVVAVVLLSVFVALPVLWSIAGIIIGAFGVAVGCFAVAVAMVVLGVTTMGWSVLASIGIILLAVAVIALGSLALALGSMAIKGTVLLVKWYISICKKMIGGAK